MSWTAYQRDWYYANLEREREKRKQTAQQFREKHPDRRMLQGAKDRCKKRRLAFDLTLDDIVIPPLCPVFGVPMERKTRYAPSLDRIDPSKGYVKGNVQVISNLANLMKQDATPEELQRFAEWLISQR